MPKGSNAARTGSGEVGFQPRHEGKTNIPTPNHTPARPPELRTDMTPQQINSSVTAATERFHSLTGLNPNPNEIQSERGAKTRLQQTMKPGQQWVIHRYDAPITIRGNTQTLHSQARVVTEKRTITRASRNEIEWVREGETEPIHTTIGGEDVSLQQVDSNKYAMRYNSTGVVLTLELA